MFVERKLNRGERNFSSDGRIEAAIEACQTLGGVDGTEDGVGGVFGRLGDGFNHFGRNSNETSCLSIVPSELQIHRDSRYAMTDEFCYDSGGEMKGCAFERESSFQMFVRGEEDGAGGS